MFKKEFIFLISIYVRVRLYVVIDILLIKFIHCINRTDSLRAPGTTRSRACRCASRTSLWRRPASSSTWPPSSPRLEPGATDRPSLGWTRPSPPSRKQPVRTEPLDPLTCSVTQGESPLTPEDVCLRQSREDVICRRL